MRFILLLLPILFSFDAFAQANIEALTKRIEDLERQQEELLILSSNQGPNKVSSFLKDNLSFGGFFEPAYTILDGPDTISQASYSSSLLGINIAADYGARFKFVTQFLTALGYPLSNQHNNPDAVNFAQPETRQHDSLVFATLLTQGYLEYAFNSSYRLQGGLGYVPFGYAFQQREPVLFIRRSGPQVLRTSNLVFPLWTGFNFLARHQLKNSSWGYNLYTFTHSSARNTPGYGGRAYWSSAEEKYTAGLSSQVGKIGATNYETFGTDFRYNNAPFVLTVEYAHQFLDETQPWSAYVEPGLYVLGEELLIYVSADYAYARDNKLGPAATAIPDPYQRWEYGIGLNWLPTSFTRIRLGLTYYDYVGDTAVVKGQDRDFYGVDISGGIAF